MTLQQKAYKKIDQMTDDKIRQLLIFIDNMQVKPIQKSIESANNKNAARGSTGSEAQTSKNNLTKSEKMQKFLATAGKIKIDAQAVNDLRERSMI